jgi:hypothetical protein
MRRNVLEMRTSVLSLLALLSAATCFGSAKAAVIPPCTVPNAVTSTSQMTGISPVLARVLRAHIGELGAPGTEFDATDIIVTGRSHRLIFVWAVGKRWVVATEQGGIFYSDRIYAYDLSPDGGSATLVQERMAFPDTVCSTASSLLSFDPRTP